ncbi:cell wall hydrolase [Natronospora cellulosivora (SeqCode)]
MRRLKRKALITSLLVVLAISLFAVSSLETVEAGSWQYTVRRGDSLWRIANNYGTTVNGISGDRIQPGQVLNIPGGNSSAAANNAGGSIGRLSSAERDLFARVVMAEAGGEPYTGQVGVAAVILNRINSSEFPNTLNDVIYQRHAFEAVTNGSIWRRTPTDSVQRAVDEAMNGWDPTYGSLFFWNPYKPVTPWIWSRPIQVQYGDHVFAR